MRQIHSTAYGLLEFEDNQLYSFEAGILGIPNIQQYGLFPMEDTPFFILHALDEEVSFVLIPAEQAIQDYSFRLAEDAVSLLEINAPEDVGVMLIVNIQQDELYLNLMAPILVSPHSLKGCQYVIKDQDLSIRYPLVQKGDG
ncbi:flagellar assembly protein FliW [Paenibacillus segetis]|uniref:Flagellar assembly factor FliW n=1 Tax=Paenibacillus segetis TaxID=1325360 RepID=A0ABQ1YNR2_9BACL|nr:flagellar assembly protein FliW [Paenibacillus segetis]GGH33002.1 hypothetical protein GCM10008013_37770 [Paenibacillus segetis]